MLPRRDGIVAPLGLPRPRALDSVPLLPIGSAMRWARCAAPYTGVG